jgi:hypothetical protein
MRKGLHWNWDATLRIEYLCKKLDLHSKSSYCSKKLWNSSKPLSFVMESKTLSLYKKNSKGPNVSYCKGNHIIFEPCRHGFCYEPIPWSIFDV